MRLYLAIALVLALAVTGSWWTTRPGSGPIATPSQTYPWQIEQLTDGSTRVFGLTLGGSSLLDARKPLGKESGLQIFVAPDKSLALEAYFDRITLGGLTAKVVLGLAMEPEILEEMATRSPKRQGSPSGSWRLDLAEQDAVAASRGKIITISYLPTVQLEASIVEKLFGPPTEKIISDEDTQHWLYPLRGLDITLHRTQKGVFQYVHPGQFYRLRLPLTT